MRRVLVMVVVLAVVSIAFVSMNASAVPSFTWNTTAAFDSGNKTDSGPQPVNWFASNGVDQTNYGTISVPSSVYSPSQQKTYYVYQGGSNFLPYIIYYDHVAKTWSLPQAVASTNPVSGDGHGAPSMWVDSDGYIFVFYGSHSTAQKAVVTTYPYDTRYWTQLPDVAPHTTYPHLFEYNGWLYVMYRDGNFSWTWKQSYTRGLTWTQGNYFAPWVGGTGGFYIGADKLVGNKLYWQATALDDPGLIRRDNYICVWNLVNNHQYGVNGVDMGISVNRSEVNANCRTLHTDLNSWSNTFDMDTTTGNIYVLINVNYSGSWHVNFTKWNGSAWSVPYSIQSNDGSSSYMQLIVHNSTSVTGFLTGGGFHDVSWTDDYSGDMQHWTYNGVSWTFDYNILTEAQNGLPLNHPVVPLNHVAELELIFDEWFWGPQPPWLPTERMFAWGSGKFVQNRLAGTLNQLETNTDNPSISPNSLSLWSGRGDTFGSFNPTASSPKWRNQQSGDAPGGPANASFVNGAFNVKWTSTGGSGRKGDSIIGAFGIGGDFNVQFSEHPVTIPATGSMYTTLCMKGEPNACDIISLASSVGASGVYYSIVTNAALQPQSIYRAFTLGFNNTIAQVGSDTYVTCDPCWARMVRSGNMYQFYRSSNGASWTLDETANLSASPAQFFVSMGIAGNVVTSGSYSVNINDYALNAGTLLFNGYGTYGIWTSPTMAYDGNRSVPKSITLSYAGASVSSYITSVRLVGVDGQVLYQNDTKITGGSSVTMNIPQDNGFVINSRENMTLRMTFIGGGVSSVDVTSVVVSYNTQFYVGEQALIYGPQVFIWLGVMVVALIGAFWLKKKRDGAGL